MCVCFQLLVLSFLHYGAVYGYLLTLGEISEFRCGAFEMYVYFGCSAGVGVLLPRRVRFRLSVEYMSNFVEIFVCCAV